MRRIATLLLFLLACSVNKATGERQFNLISTQQEIELGKQAVPEFQKGYGGEIPDNVVDQYVRDVGRTLAATSERPNLPWEFHVVDSSVVNAFALPGGKVFVTRGLLEKLHSEAELAGVIGHEIGHVTAQHIGQQMSRQMALVLATTAVGVVAAQRDSDWLRALGVGATLGGSVYLLKFGRDQEIEADGLGMRYMSRAGWDPAAQRDVLAMLGTLERDEPAPPEILSTHPSSENRVAHVDRLLRTEYAGKTGARDVHRYENKVLARLDDLPPARHSEETQRAAAAAQRALDRQSCRTLPDGRLDCRELGEPVSD